MFEPLTATQTDGHVQTDSQADDQTDRQAGRQAGQPSCSSVWLLCTSTVPWPGSSLQRHTAKSTGVAFCIVRSVAARRGACVRLCVCCLLHRPI